MQRWWAAPGRAGDLVDSRSFGSLSMLTYLTSKGLSDAQIQLISGHESKKSLEVYQHLSLESVDKAYQEAAQTVGIWCKASLRRSSFCGILRAFVGCWNLNQSRRPNQ
jgi:hypothetical protein